MEIISKKDINLSEWEFEYQQRDKQTILLSDFFGRSAFEKREKEINLPIIPPDYLFTSSNKGYAKINQMKNIIESLRKAIGDEKYVDYLFKATLKRMGELEKFSDKVISILKKKSELSRKEILDLWEEFDEIVLIAFSWFYIPWYVTEYNLLTDRIKQKLEKNEKIKQITNINNSVAILSFPIKKAMFQEEQKDFFELCKLVKDKNDFKDLAEKYLKEHAWMKTFMTLPIDPLSIQELMDRVNEEVKGDFISQHEIQEKQKIKNNEITKKLLKEINDSELISFIEQARELGWLLTFSVELAMRSLGNLIPFYKILAKELGVDYLQWNNLKSSEIIEILKGKLKISNKELEERSNGFVFLMENGKEGLIVGEKGKELAEYLDENIGAVDENIKEIRGQGACSGVVRGKVRITLTPKESYKLEKGEILVCSMTSPDYIPAMKRAAAFITDEGGLLCHAAIISREMNKPCIIKTKIATRVLKTGDLIEVDAGKGIVKVLKKR